MDREIIEMLKEPGALRRRLDDMNIVDIADEFENIDGPDVIKVFRMLAKDKAAEVFAYLETDVQQSIIEAITDKELKSIVEDLYLDDAVDFLEEMPSNVVNRVLANVTPDTRKMINQFLNYPEDSAGSIMTVEYVNLKGGMTVADAFAHIRATGMDKETIYTCYVTDGGRRLIGSISARTLFLANKYDLIADLMERDVIFAHTEDDRETLMSRFRNYGLIAMPVVDKEERLVGIVTFDDALLVQKEEDTEDFEKMAAMSPSDDPYLKTGILTMSKNRLPWLLLLNLSVFFTSAVVANYEDALAGLPILMTFIPMLMDSSGNAGSQSSTLIIRGMALDEITMPDFLAVLWKEVRVSVVCGLTLAVANFVRMLIFGHSAGLGLTVSLALLAAIVLAKILGAILPLGAKIIKIDPAVMAGPVLTTLVDLLSLMLYFNLAKVIMKI